MSSSILQKKFGISSKHSSTSLFLKDLQKGICYPEELRFLSEKHKIEERVLDTILAKLRAHGLLIEEETIIPPPEEKLYDRQIRFFRSFERPGASGEELHKNLQNRTILIVGLGGYGSWTALLCARMGIQKHHWCRFRSC